MANNGVLYICATPIGNLDDITLRVLKTLKQVHFIAAEDTRVSIKLLNYYEISTPLTSYHHNNRHQKAQYILKRLKDGQNVALITDAGLPCISDPGVELVNLCYKEGIKVTICPGASASLSAFVLSGYQAPYVFFGFLPQNNAQKKKAIDMLKTENSSIIIYEAPHRLLKTLKQLNLVMGERQIAIIRELTKRFEQVQHFSLSEATEYYSQNTARGEFVLVLKQIEGQPKLPESLTDKELIQLIRQFISKGCTEKEAIKAAANQTTTPKRKVYEVYKIKNKFIEG